MAKVHPNAAAAAPVAADEPAVPTHSNTTVAAAAADHHETEPPTVLTVWRKSLLFNCDGFTVYDAHGDLAFRVDSYARRSRRRRAEVVLMDATGTTLLTVRRKTLSLPERWLIYDGADADCSTRPAPLVTVRRHVGGGKTLAHVAVAEEGEGDQAFVVEGSYARRACAVRDARGGDVVADVRRKEAVLGDDVFRLVVSSSSRSRRLGAPLAMGIVIALDQMFAAGRGSWLRSAGAC